MILTLKDQTIWIAAGAGLVMLLLWLIQWRTRDAGVVDVGWAACLGAAAAFCALTGAGDPARRAIIGVMGAVWGFRLALHLLFDRVLKGPEDGRYQLMREKLGTKVNPVFLAFFLAQAVLVQPAGAGRAALVAAKGRGEKMRLLEHAFRSAVELGVSL